MNYSQLLDKAIVESGLSLRQIEKRCKDMGLSITPSYISQLKNGKLPPPRPEVTEVLVKVLQARDETQLIFQSYFDKAPEIIKEYMAASSQLNQVMLDRLCEVKGNDEFTKAAKEFLSELDILSDVDLTPSGVIKKASPDLLVLPINSDDMEPILPRYSTLSISPTNPSLLKSKDMIALKKGGLILVRRVYFTGEEILLIPDNKNSEIFKIHNFESIDYIGRVVGYRLEF